MKRLIFSASVLLLGLHELRSQIIHIECGLSLLSCNQFGNIYPVIEGHQPTLYSSPVAVDRASTKIGACLYATYPLNFGHFFYDKLSYGIQTGIAINSGTTEQSFVAFKNYNTTIRIPALFNFRVGVSNGDVRKRFGFGFSFGAEYIRAAFADETGNFITPKIAGAFGIKNLNLTLNFYPIDLKSYYLINDTKTIRLRNSLFEFQFTLRLTHIPKRYRAAKWEKAKLKSR